jgi:hypothetical protein
VIVVLGSVVWLGAWFAMASAIHAYWLIALGFGVWLVGIVAFSYVTSVASQVFRCALFLYASQGALPAPYTEDMMALAWRTKKG